MGNARRLIRHHAILLRRRSGAHGPVTPAVLHLPAHVIPPTHRRLPTPRQAHLGLAAAVHPVVVVVVVAPARVLGRGGRVQVDVEGKDVAGEDEGDDPLQHGARVVVLGERAGDEGDGEQDLDDDEGELEVEGEAEDSLFAVAYLLAKIV